MFNTTDAMLYVDADAYFLDDVAELWDELKKFNQKQILALAPDYYSKQTFSQKPERNIPYIAPNGTNAGVILMNLTRIREFKMYEKLAVVYRKYEKDILCAEQDLLNILFNQSTGME